MWSLDDPDVHEPRCIHCRYCMLCLRMDGDELCVYSEDGQHESEWKDDDNE